MMDFGYLGSSSNLSPLAPPFTLDRTFPRPNTENFVNFTDLPPTGPFPSSLPSWQYSPPSASNPNLYSIPSADMGVDSIRTTYLTSENFYPYFGVPSISSPSTQMPPLNVDVSTTPEAFVFSQFSSEIPTSQVESKTYCPSFVSPVVEDDDPLVVLQKPNYSLSSTSHITSMGGSSQVDYHQSLSGLEYKPQWGSYWDRIDRLADGEVGKQQVEYDGSFCSTKTDGVASFAYQSYPKEGASIAEGFSMGKEASAVPNGTCLNLLGGESQTVTPATGEMDYKPFSSQRSSFTPYNPARISGVSTLPKSHAYVPPVEPAPTILNHQNPYASQNQSSQLFNAGKVGSVTIKKPSPPLVIRPPSSGSNPRLEKKDHVSDSDSSNIKRGFPIKPLAEKIEGNLSKSEMEPQLPAMNALSYIFTSASDKAKGVSSVEGPLESLDRYYPALDSPCWKGSSSFRFSPAEDREAVIPEHLVKKPESLGGLLKLQQSHYVTPFEDDVKITGQKVHENNVYQGNGYVELGSLLCPVRLPNASSPVKVDNATHEDEVDNAKLSNSRVDTFSDHINKLTKNYGTTNHLKSCTGLRHSQLKHLDAEKDLELGFGVAEARSNCSDASSKVRVQKLVDTIHNLSEVLLLQCSEDTSALLEVDHVTLKLAMENLDACVSKAVPKPTQESEPHKSVISGMPQVTKETSSNHQNDNHLSPQGTKHNELSEKEVEKFTDLFSTRVNEDFVKDDKVTRAIKKVLEENFTADKERQSETLLYKNLWLEAEAALCSVTFRARYDRMKTEMDTHKSPKTKAEPAKTFEELYSEVFPDPGSPEKGNPIIEAFKILHKSTQDPSASKPTETADEADASFRARLHILNNRVPSRNSISEEDQTDEEADAAFAETIKNVEKLLSSEDADDRAMVNLTQKGPPHTIGSMNDDNVEARVMARFQLLKNRDFNVVSEQSGQQSGQVVSSEFSGETNPWRFNAVLFEDDIADRSLSQIGKVSEHKQNQLCGAAGVNNFHVYATDFQLRGNERMDQLYGAGGVKDFNVYATDLQHCGNERMVTQPALEWCDNSLSDWEDVLKDDHCR